MYAQKESVTIHPVADRQVDMVSMLVHSALSQLVGPSTAQTEPAGLLAV